VNIDLAAQGGGYTPPSFDEALVADVMHPGVLTCPPETPLTTVARMMGRYRVHAIVVTDFEAEGEGERPWRVVSDLDMAGAAAAGEFSDMTAGGIAATEVVSVSSDESLREGARIMSEHEVAHLIVTDPGSSAPVGILSTLDLAGAVSVRSTA
jgi:CBS domain-containing protein